MSHQGLISFSLTSWLEDFYSIFPKCCHSAHLRKQLLHWQKLHPSLQLLLLVSLRQICVLPNGNDWGNCRNKEIKVTSTIIFTELYIFEGTANTSCFFTNVLLIFHHTTQAVMQNRNFQRFFMLLPCHSVVVFSQQHLNWNSTEVVSQWLQQNNEPSQIIITCLDFVFGSCSQLSQLQKRPRKMTLKQLYGHLLWIYRG